MAFSQECDTAFNTKKIREEAHETTFINSITN